MKISILLPYKENFSPTYPGAVSLFVYETSRISKYKNNIIVYGNTNYKNIFKINYHNINLDKSRFQSISKKYIENFIKIEKKYNSDLLEVHNRPNYLNYLYKFMKNKKYILYFHNDPLTMVGSKNVTERKFLLKICYRRFRK